MSFAGEKSDVDGTDIQIHFGVARNAYRTNLPLGITPKSKNLTFIRTDA